MSQATLRRSVTETAHGPIRIVGIGNPIMRDDGVGPRVVEMLRQVDLPPEVEAIDGGTGGLDLLDLLEGAVRVVFVDAVNFGGPPGQIEVFSPDAVRRLNLGPIASLHSVSLLDALELGDALGMALPDVKIVGVQPFEIAPGLGLSPALQSKLPEVINTVLGLLPHNHYTKEGEMSDG